METRSMTICRMCYARITKKEAANCYGYCRSCYAIDVELAQKPREDLCTKCRAQVDSAQAERCRGLCPSCYVLESERGNPPICTKCRKTVPKGFVLCDRCWADEPVTIPEYGRQENKTNMLNGIFGGFGILGMPNPGLQNRNETQGSQADRDAYQQQQFDAYRQEMRRGQQNAAAGAPAAITKEQAESLLAQLRISGWPPSPFAQQARPQPKRAGAEVVPLKTKRKFRI